MSLSSGAGAPRSNGLRTPPRHRRPRCRL